MAELPNEMAISAVTLAELSAGLRLPGHGDDTTLGPTTVRTQARLFRFQS